MADAPIHAVLPSRAVVMLRGLDWRPFLQGLLTQDVDEMLIGELRFAGLLTPQGRLLFDLFVLGGDEECLLDVAAQHRAALIQRLTMYRLRAKVEISAPDVRVAVLFPAEGAHGWSPDPRLPALGLRGYGVEPPAGAVPAGEAAYEAHRLALGVPGSGDWGSDTTYPIEADFDLLGGIDFQKGCFVGQETTSRMKRRGQVKSRMLPVVFDGSAPAPGTELLAGDLRAGEVLSGVEGRAMALVRLDRALGVELTANGRPARVEIPDWYEEG